MKFCTALNPWAPPMVACKQRCR